MDSTSEWPKNIWSLPNVHVPLDLEGIHAFPLLAQALDVWRRAAVDGFPQTIDPLDMPPALIKGISLLEWREDLGDWYVRLASTLLNEGHGRPMTGTSLAEAYKPEDVDPMRRRVWEMFERGEPVLGRYEFEDARGRVWAYVRLGLPLSSDGVKQDRYAQIFDPETFGQRLSG